MEKRDLYDINRNLTGKTIFKCDAIPESNYIVVVLVFIQNSEGKFLIQKRSKIKNGKYATTGGHPKSGENSIQGIISEVKEEIGLNINPKDLNLYYSGKSDSEKVFWDDYYIKMDIPNIQNLSLQKEEVESVCWLSIDEINSLMNEDKFFRNHYEEFEILLNWLNEGEKINMNNIDYLDEILEVKIDRPLGSKHPKHGFIYPINSGYVPNTTSGDGEELDCYVLGIYEPLETFKGKCIAIIHRLNDNDDKLIIVPECKSFSNNEIKVLTEFQEQYFKSEIIRSSNYLEFSKNIPELSVTNLENSLKFYKTLGFKIEYDRPENKFAFLSLGEIQFMIQELTDNNKWDVAPLSYPFGNGINFQLEVDNVELIYNNLLNINYKIEFEIEENWYRQDNKLLGNKEFLVQDPDGYLLRFFEDLGEK